MTKYKCYWRKSAFWELYIFILIWKTCEEHCSDNVKVLQGQEHSCLVPTNITLSCLFLKQKPKKTFISILFCWIYCFTNAWPNHMTQSWNWSWEDLVSGIFYWRSFFALFARWCVKIFKWVKNNSQQQNHFHAYPKRNHQYHG